MSTDYREMSETVTPLIERGVGSYADLVEIGSVIAGHTLDAGRVRLGAEVPEERIWREELPVALSYIREMGSARLEVSGPPEIAREVAEVASRHYPAEWIRRSNEHSTLKAGASGPVTLVTGVIVSPAIVGLPVLLSFYPTTVTTVALLGVLSVMIPLGICNLLRRERPSISTPVEKPGGAYIPLAGYLWLHRDPGRAGWEYTVAHELSHRFERTVTCISSLERQFLKYRTGLSLPVGPGWWLVRALPGCDLAYGGGFFNDYTGKDYGSGKMYEVLSAGYEAMLAGDPRWKERRDDEHRDFVIGALAAL